VFQIFRIRRATCSAKKLRDISPRIIFVSWFLLEEMAERSPATQLRLHYYY